RLAGARRRRRDVRGGRRPAARADTPRPDRGRAARPAPEGAGAPPLPAGPRRPPLARLRPLRRRGLLRPTVRTRRRRAPPAPPGAFRPRPARPPRVPAADG